MLRESGELSTRSGRNRERGSDEHASESHGVVRASVK